MTIPRVGRAARALHVTVASESENHFEGRSNPIETAERGTTLAGRGIALGPISDLLMGQNYFVSALRFSGGAVFWQMKRVEA